MNTKLVDDIYWVGAVDWNIRDFHGYETIRGSSYNSYMICDEKTVLIDSVKAPFCDVLLQNMQALTPLDKVDYVICNHAEPDHSGSLPKVMEMCSNAVLMCDAKCKAILSKHYDTSSWNIQVVKTGDELKTGKYTLQFAETPMAHWPDSMAVYLPEKKVLFSMDAFGQHYATSARFDDEVPHDVAMMEAKTYYANILMCYERPVTNALNFIDNLDVDLIAPSHGIMWRKHIKEILSSYRTWAACTPSPKVLIMYDTMWKSTDKMAHAIYEGVIEKGVECELRYIRETHITILATEILDAPVVAVGSATLNQTLMPQAAAALTYLMGLRPSGKSGFAFGSYGWGKGGAEAIQEYLDKMKIRTLREPLKSQYVPTAEVLEECRTSGNMLAEEALKICGEKNAVG